MGSPDPFHFGMRHAFFVAPTGELIQGLLCPIVTAASRGSYPM